MTDPDNTPTSAQPDKTVYLTADVSVTPAGVLTVALDNGETLEVALTREGAAQLVVQLAEYAYPTLRLRTATPAGQA